MSELGCAMASLEQPVLVKEKSTAPTVVGRLIPGSASESRFLRRDYYAGGLAHRFLKTL